MQPSTSVLKICLISSLSGLLIGLNLSSMSGFLDVMAFSADWHYPMLLEREMVTAAMPLGSVIGAIVSWMFVDIIGQPSMLRYGSLIWVFGSAFMALGMGMAMLCIGRVLAGLAVGIVSAIAPVYMAEIAPKDRRGAFMSLLYTFIGLGFMLQNATQYIATMATGRSFDTINKFDRETVVSVLRASYVFQAAFGLSQSQELMAKLQKRTINDPKVLAQFWQLRHEVRGHRLQGRPRVAMLFHHPERRKLVLGLFAQAWNQLCGAHVIFYHIVFILLSSELWHPNLYIFIQYLVNVIASLMLGSRLADSWGRRLTLLVGSLAMSVCLIIMGILGSEYEVPSPFVIPSPVYHNFEWVIENKAVSNAMFAFVCLFTVAYASSWGPVSWIYSAEIFPSHLRSRGAGLSTAYFWVGDVVMDLAVPNLINMLAFFTVMGAFNETSRGPLEEMEEVFDGSYAWQFQRRGVIYDRLVARFEAGTTDGGLGVASLSAPETELPALAGTFA
ncbi:general substrate transporter [Trichoderma chlorosporum]